MSQEKSKNNLINWELVAANPNNKNWNWKDLFCFWGVNIQSIIGFSLIASLYTIYSLNTFVVFFGTILGYIFLKELITIKVLISLIAVCIGIYFVKKADNKTIFSR